MDNRIVYLLLLVQCHIIVGRNRGDSCTTPNNEPATCVAIQNCQIILNAIATQNNNAVKFAQDSQCGYDTTPLVCCGKTAYPTPPTTTTTTPKNTPLPTKVTEPHLLNYETVEDSDVLPDRTVCGLEKEQRKVFGGMITDLDEFPWMAALEFKSKLTGKNSGIRCGGSLINDRYVLTAAHCLLDKEFQLISVWLGDWNVSSDPDCIKGVAISECSSVLKLQIEKQLPHPYYSSKSNNNDIGLLKLENDIEYTDYIRPICLPPPDLPNPVPNTYLTVAGWGATENGTSSDIKLKVEVPLLSNIECSSRFSSKLNSNQLCAGGESGKDSCEGDSGGPLMRTYQDSNTFQWQWYQEGVVSSGVGCARPGHPAVYTRVSRYIKWILKNISDDV